MNTRYVVFSSLLILAVCSALAARAAILGGGVVNLQPSEPLAGVISQSLGTSGKSRLLPIAGKDYVIQKTSYFDNHSWLIAAVAPKGGHADQVTIIMHIVNGAYQVVLGPGTNFPNTYLQVLPNDVADYLINQGLIYEPVIN